MVPVGNKAKHLSSVNHTTKKQFILSVQTVSLIFKWCLLRRRNNFLHYGVLIEVFVNSYRSFSVINQSNEL